MNANCGWETIMGRPAVVSLLEKSEAECRSWAREHANREDFVDHDASDWTDADTDSAVDEWVNDTGDDVAPDTSVFWPEIQSWEDGSWRDVSKKF